MFEAPMFQMSADASGEIRDAAAELQALEITLLPGAAPPIAPTSGTRPLAPIIGGCAMIVAAIVGASS